MKNKNLNNHSDKFEGEAKTKAKFEIGNDATSKKYIPDKKNIFYIWLVLPVILLILIILPLVFYKTGVFQSLKNFSISKNAPFFFLPEPSDGSKTLEEAGSMKKSPSSDWWLNSGGYFKIYDDGFSTQIGPLPKNDKWRKLYAKSNPRDTDDGYYPQNIFRLVTRKKWQNFSQTLYLNIEKTNLSDSKYRNESNGVLLFNRYQDGENLYYTGLRVDGQAVIKKKIDGKYYTLAEKKIFSSDRKYDRDENPNLLPENIWLGIKSELINIERDTVEIKLYLDKEDNGDWQLVLDTKDKSSDNNQAPFLDEGYAGIRTDFMDVKFKNYSVKEIR